MEWGRGVCQTILNSLTALGMKEAAFQTLWCVHVLPYQKGVV